MSQNDPSLNNKSTTSNGLAGLIRAAGAILAISYPVLALSTGVRAIYQIVEGDPTNSPWLSLLAATFYTIATIGFVKQPRPEPKNSKKREPGRLRRSLLFSWYDRITAPQAWRISMGILVIESFMTLLVGTLSYVAPDLLGRNVWTHFGADYGYFPLIQPLLGLAWLIHPETLRVYGLKK